MDLATGCSRKGQQGPADAEPMVPRTMQREGRGNAQHA